MSLNKRKMYDQARLYLDTWNHPPAASHPDGAGVNRYVEAARASPYTAGRAAYFRCPPVLFAKMLKLIFKNAKD